MRTCALADPIQNSLVRDFWKVSSLDISRHTSQSSSQGILWGSVNHLWSDRSGVRRPGEENNFRSLTFVSTELILEIINGVQAIVFWQFGQKVVIRLAGGCLFNHDRGLVIIQSIQDKLVLLTQFEVIECLKRLVVNGNTGIRVSTRKFVESLPFYLYIPRSRHCFGIRRK